MVVACLALVCDVFFFFNDTATTEIYTLSLHDALPISRRSACASGSPTRAGRTDASSGPRCSTRPWPWRRGWRAAWRSEEHTSELQSLAYLVCRLLLEKKKKIYRRILIVLPPCKRAWMR